MANELELELNEYDTSPSLFRFCHSSPIVKDSGDLEIREVVIDEDIREAETKMISKIEK